MKRLICLLLSIVCLCGCASSNNSTTHSSSDKPSIAVTSVAILEILDALGYDNVVGIPDTSGSIPERYKNITEVGSPMNPDLEIIKSVDPDLVLSPQSLESGLSESYSKAGISSAFLDLSSVEGMYKAIESLGSYLGLEDKAEELIDDYTQYIENTDYKNNESIVVLMAFPDGFYLVATENSYVGNLLKLTGAKNVYGSDYKGDENGIVEINPEDILLKDPDHIYVFAHYGEEEAFKYMQEEFKTSSSWKYFDAVNEGNITYLPSEYFGMSASLDWKDSYDYLINVMKEAE